MKSYRSNEKIQNNVNKNVSTDYLSPRNDFWLKSKNLSNCISLCLSPGGVCMYSLF